MLGSNYAMEAWFKPTSCTLSDSGTVITGPFWGRYQVSLSMDSQRQFRMTHVHSDSTPTYAEDVTSREVDFDYHVVGVRNINSDWLGLWVNGSLVASASTGGKIGCASLSPVFGWGAFPLFKPYQVVGVLDECRAYAFAPTDAQIKRMYRGDYSFLTSGQLQLHYGFDNIGSEALTNSGYAQVYSTVFENSPAWIERQEDERRGTGTPEYISLFVGDVTRVEYNKAKIGITMADKLTNLAERIVGTNADSPAIMGPIIPSDIAWTLCTCYGALDSTANSSNPDIDWASFQAWAAVFSADSVTMQMRVQGKKVLEAMRDLTNLTQSACYMASNKLHFARFTNINTNITSLGIDDFTDVRASIEEADIINKFWSYGNYDPTSKNWNLGVFEVKTASINSYGLHEGYLRSENFWYVTSLDAATIAQRVMFTSGEPYERVEVSALLQPMLLYIGETLIVAEPHIGVSNGWRVMQRSINMDNGTMKLSTDGSQIVTPFLLDISALDGGDLLQ